MSLTDRAQTSQRHYDRVMYVDSILAPKGEYFEGSSFANYGYWKPETTSAREACENLMERLLAFVPEKKGSILDVACGLGATTRHLLRYYAPGDVTAIDASEKNVETGRENAPGCSFFNMDATSLDFPDECFDTIISVEAALHFQTREKFLREALRVLKPGGHIVLSDVLHDRWTDVVSPLLPAENHVESPEHYREVLERAGFTDAKVDDVTEESWIRSNLNATRFICGKYASGEIDKRTFNRLMTHRMLRLISTRYYVVAAGRKPEQAPAGERLGAEVEGVAVDAEALGRQQKGPKGLQVLVEHATFAFMERKARFRRASRAQRAIAKVLRDTGDLAGAERYMKLSRLYGTAARNIRPGGRATAVDEAGAE